MRVRIALAALLTMIAVSPLAAQPLSSGSVAPNSWACAQPYRCNEAYFSSMGMCYGGDGYWATMGGCSSCSACDSGWHGLFSKCTTVNGCPYWASDPCSRTIASEMACDVKCFFSRMHCSNHTRLRAALCQALCQDCSLGESCDGGCTTCPSTASTCGYNPKATPYTYDAPRAESRHHAPYQTEPYQSGPYQSGPVRESRREPTHDSVLRAGYEEGAPFIDPKTSRSSGTRYRSRSTAREDRGRHYEEYDSYDEPARYEAHDRRERDAWEDDSDRYAQSRLYREEAAERARWQEEAEEQARWREEAEYQAQLRREQEAQEREQMREEARLREYEQALRQAEARAYFQAQLEADARREAEARALYQAQQQERAEREAAAQAQREALEQARYQTQLQATAERYAQFRRYEDILQQQAAIAAEQTQAAPQAAAPVAAPVTYAAPISTPAVSHAAVAPELMAAPQLMVAPQAMATEPAPVVCSPYVLSPGSGEASPAPVIDASQFGEAGMVSRRATSRTHGTGVDVEIIGYGR